MAFVTTDAFRFTADPMKLAPLLQEYGGDLNYHIRDGTRIGSILLYQNPRIPPKQYSQLGVKIEHQKRMDTLKAISQRHPMLRLDETVKYLEDNRALPVMRITEPRDTRMYGSKTFICKLTHNQAANASTDYEVKLTEHLAKRLVSPEFLGTYGLPHVHVIVEEYLGPPMWSPLWEMVQSVEEDIVFSAFGRLAGAAHNEQEFETVRGTERGRVLIIDSPLAHAYIDTLNNRARLVDVADAMFVTQSELRERKMREKFEDEFYTFLADLLRVSRPKIDAVTFGHKSTRALESAVTDFNDGYAEKSHIDLSANLKRAIDTVRAMRSGEWGVKRFEHKDRNLKQYLL